MQRHFFGRIMFLSNKNISDFFALQKQTEAPSVKSFRMFIHVLVYINRYPITTAAKLYTCTMSIKFPFFAIQLQPAFFGQPKVRTFSRRVFFPNCCAQSALERHKFLNKFQKHISRNVVQIIPQLLLASANLAGRASHQLRESEPHRDQP